MLTIQKKKKMNTRKLMFYICLIALPTLQYIIFYIGVNFNSFLLAFRSFDRLSGEYSWAGLSNFQQAFSDSFMSKMGHIRLKNSLIVFSCSLLIVMSLGILFSYYIYKGKIFSEFFKTIIFLPQMISGLVFVIIFMNLVDSGIPIIVEALTGKKIQGLYANIETQFETVLFFSIWSSFGSSMLMYLTAMSSINESVVEAAKIDGDSFLKEFWYITLPAIWPTFTTFLIVSVAQLFTNQMNLFSFGGQYVSADMHTVGYYIFRELYINQSNKSAWPPLAALGLILTLIIVSTVNLIRYLCNKYGPSEV